MSALITIIHVIICLILIIAVLMQSGKAADLAGAFGGGGSATAVGARGQASIMAKVTEVCAILFMFTSLGLWVLSGKESSSAVKGTAAVPAKDAAATTETKKEPTPTAPTADKVKKQPETKPVEKKAPDAAPRKAAAPETKK
ncbi:MAG: preprotein translocase subunit SecG [Candidatus Aminicenantes bacterium]|nr:preprotein translocase subunit SecG [Candidatus Aminicenantes bacterium]